MELLRIFIVAVVVFQFGLVAANNLPSSFPSFIRWIKQCFVWLLIHFTSKL